MLRLFLGALALSVCGSAFSFSDTEVDREFHQSFNTHYEARQCGNNIRGLLERLETRGYDMKNISLVMITNKGFTVFGMVNAEYTRAVRFNKPAVDESNWYHHVIAVDDRGYVYDYDFGIKPSVLKFGEYVEKMFLDESECETPRSFEFCAGRERKLKDYKLEWHKGAEFLESGEDNPYWTSTLGEAVEHFAN